MTVGDPETDWTRSPELDPGAILKCLNRHGVKYVVIGGFAAQLHQAAVTTDDIDITPQPSTANLKRLADALAEMDARLRAQGLPPGGMRIPLDAATFKDMTTVTFITRHGPLDVALKPDGTDGYHDLIQHALTFSYRGIEAGLAGLGDVIRSKEASGRPKDVAAMPALRLRLRQIEAERAQNADPPRKGGPGSLKS